MGRHIFVPFLFGYMGIYFAVKMAFLTLYENGKLGWGKISLLGDGRI